MSFHCSVGVLLGAREHRGADCGTTDAPPHELQHQVSSFCVSGGAACHVMSSEGLWGLMLGLHSPFPARCSLICQSHAFEAAHIMCQHGLGAELTMPWSVACVRLKMPEGLCACATPEATLCSAGYVSQHLLGLQNQVHP